MSVTLEIPDQLAEQLRALALEREISIEELGRQVLAIGLTILTEDMAADIVDIEPTRETHPLSDAVVSMRSPIVTTTQVRLRPITIEPPTDMRGDAD